MNILRQIPFLFYLLIIYNVVAFFSPDAQALMNSVCFTCFLISGAVLKVNVSDIFIILGMIILYFEILKSTRASIQTVIDHALSMVVFVVFLVEFIVVKYAGTNAFLILTLMAFLDVITGFTVTISSARRDISVN